jgi:hypothetical protein
MVIRAALCMLLIAAAVPAQWKRYSESDEPGAVDSPPAHDLRYFRVDPCSRNDEKERFGYCEPDGETQRWARTRTNLRTVGKIGDFTIYDLEYFLDIGYPGPHLRSVLVETPGHLFHEIYLQESLSGVIFPTEILKAGQQPVIKVKWDDNGNCHIVYEKYFVILGDVAALLSFGPAIRAAEKALPRGKRTYQPMSEFNLKSLVYSIGTERVDAIGQKVACCDGHISVPFRIEEGLVVAGKAEFVSGYFSGFDQ